MSKKQRAKVEAPVVPTKPDPRVRAAYRDAFAKGYDERAKARKRQEEGKGADTVTNDVLDGGSRYYLPELTPPKHPGGNHPGEPDASSPADPVQ